MATPHTSAAKPRAALTTELGTIDVMPQGDRVAYVRAAEEDRELLEAAREPLRLGRGVELRVRAHFYYEPERHAWRARQPFIYRVDQPGKEPTARMERQACDVIAARLLEWSQTPEGAAMLAGSHQAEVEGEAASRLAIGLQLRRLADALDREAKALMDGGRVEHLRGHVNGFEVRTTQVRTRDGLLLPPLKKPPSVHGSTDYPDSIQHQRPEDRW